MIKNERIKTNLRKEDFFYALPPERIAQTPVDKRDASRLMVVNRSSGAIAHRYFYDIPEYIRPEDVLVINNSKVIPARLFGADVSRPDRAVEFLLLRRRSDMIWETLVRPGKKAKPGTRFVFGDGLLFAEILEVVEGGNRLLRMNLRYS